MSISVSQRDPVLLRNYQAMSVIGRVDVHECQGRIILVDFLTLARPATNRQKMHSVSDKGSRLQRLPVDVVLERGGGAVDRLFVEGFCHQHHADR